MTAAERDYRYLTSFLTDDRRLVPLVPRTKVPFANREVSNGDHRVIISEADALALWLRTHKCSNWGLLGMVQVDPDSEEATAWVRNMGIRSGDRAWILRTRRGYKPIFKSPADCPRTHNDPTHKTADLGGPKTIIVIPPSLCGIVFSYSLSIISPMPFLVNPAIFHEFTDYMKFFSR